MKIYSETVQRHIEKESVSVQYLINTTFTLQDLRDIAESKSPKSWRPVYAGKLKLVDSSTTYARYLELSGKTIKPPINISSFYR